MAQVVLGGIGAAVGGGVGRIIGSTLGGMIDRSLVAGLEAPRQKGPRLNALALQGAAEGSPMACVLGRARVTGQVIWAARFKEGRTTSSAGKGGPRTVEYDYSLSFAVALCEGPIDGIGRVWADGQPMDTSGVTMRLHRGAGEQTPDPLIEAVEGEAPAYRGTAYVVFEDLPLGPYGNRPPQLAFEVFRRPLGSELTLEDRLEGVCLIPGAGEFVLATEAVMRREGLTRTRPENLHAGDGRTDLAVSLDQLQVQLPNLKRVSLVVGWFGDDLRAGHCTIRPGVERRGKPTEPVQWSVAGLTRDDAHLISQSGGGPAYGGTPSDESVRQAIAELKARGLEVTLYPFVFMDVPPGNGLPDPYGGPEQAAYPWRGRLTGDEMTASADVSALFGEAAGWGLRRLALHYAALAAGCGADGLLIGSEMRGLTWTRDPSGQFPAPDAFRLLAAECRAIVGDDVSLSYAADWSEYSGWREDAEAVFHLDSLWEDPNIDYVGIDWYPPLADWRDGEGGVDAGLFDGPDSADSLAAQVAGGEGFDWFYASPADRAAQVRTPIDDSAHGEHWAFRSKDLSGWWSNTHHDRPGGVRSATPTAWVPGMKPIRLCEFGCPAVDRGANAPNLFQDAKSAEGSLPPFSTGARDDRMQRRALEAVLTHFAEPANNPVSPVYGGRMLEAADAWCWDARPWPAFPARAEVWADAGAWRTGHWLNGRLGGGTRNLLAEILMRAGLTEAEFVIGDCPGEVQGYLIDRPMRVRDALEPLLGALGMVAAERDGRIAVFGDESAAVVLSPDALALPQEGSGVRMDRTLKARPGVARVRFIDGYSDYQTGSAVVRTGGEGGGLDLDLPAVCSHSLARAAAARVLEAGREDRLTVLPGPLESLALESGDTVSVPGDDRVWRALRIEMDETPSALLEPVSLVRIGENDGSPSTGEGPTTTGAPFFRLLDLPPLMDGGVDTRPVAVVAAEPWRPMRVFGGADAASLTPRGDVPESATVGQLVGGLSAGVRHRWDEVNTLKVRVEGRAPESLSTSAVLAGGNTVAVETALGWEIVQYRAAQLIGSDTWRLSGLLRGQQGTEEAMTAGAAEGAVVVFLGAGLGRAASPPAERGLPLVWRAAPAGTPPGGQGVSEITFAPTGLHDRPWSPAHPRCTARSDGGFDLSWLPRSRLDGDRWDGEIRLEDSPRYRVTILKAGAAVRSFDVDAEAAIYPGPDAVSDFPDGFDDGEWAVAEWGEGYGWGAKARARLI
ncbi:MAG: glycoside hydrolase TIM-barrel-like domain-containing protein [Brevundimonas sp.]|uniref:baseplate multidomain protein megatron n=1 Tax=Brevundimonas sp. TaxID=1871086 RepID=UPI002AB8FDCE|nr:glycoside hydrolase TIM-barrel-like domain-containing protein [Brevundimonas sp.]MDZ4110832.1 glycoside hydrolase TIM-barrel-like domain-containing protein [Brevundimonas sp.]